MLVVVYLSFATSQTYIFHKLAADTCEEKSSIKLCILWIRPYSGSPLKRILYLGAKYINFQFLTLYPTEYKSRSTHWGEIHARFALLESFHIFLTSTHLFPEERMYDKDLRRYKNNQTKGWPLIAWTTCWERGVTLIKESDIMQQLSACTTLESRRDKTLE